MATRQAPHTAAVLDNSMLKEFPSDGDSKVIPELPNNQFDSIVRGIKMMSIERVRPILTATFTVLQDLKVKRDLSRAFVGIPNGSDHFDFGTFKIWMGKIKETDKCSIEQLVAIDATAAVRVNG